MIISKKNRGLFIPFLIAFFILIAVTIHLFVIANKGIYLDLINFLTGVAFAIFAILVGITLLSFRKIIIEDKTLKVFSLLGWKKKEIYLPAMLFWIEFEKKDKYANWHELEIYNESGKFKINSRLYDNYIELIHGIKEYGYRNFEKQEAIENRKSKQTSWVLIIIGATLLLISSFFLFRKDEPEKYEASQLNLIRDVIVNEPEIIKGSKGSRSIKIVLSSYPDFVFNISGWAFKETYAEDFVRYVRLGDSVFINISKDDYGKKISKELPLGFFDKTVAYKNIDIVELGDKRNDYLTLEGYNKAMSDKGFPGTIIFLILGLVMFFLGAIPDKNKKKVVK